MKIKDILGTFSIIGTNQDNTGETYKGRLSIGLYEGKIGAKWMINKKQEQFGVGFFKNNILVINFHYNDGEEEINFGTVVYKCLTKDILEGFWSEDLGDPKFLGSENCFRIKNKNDLPC